MDRQLSGSAGEGAGTDLTASFDRVQYRGPTEPTFETLAALVVQVRDS